MAEVKKQDKRIHAIATAIRPFASVADKKLVYGEETAQSIVDAFNEHNGEDKPQLSLDILKAVDELYTDVEPALLHASGEIGIDAMVADASIETLKGHVTLGTTDFVVNQQRAYSTHNPQFGKKEGAPERIEKSGRMSVKRDVTNGGAAYSRAIDAVCAYGADLL